MPRFSVIAPTYNKAAELDCTLMGFTRQTFKDFEVVIVNDGGDDETERVVNKYDSMLNIQYTKQPNLGRSSARNHGLKLAQGNYIIHIDSDRLPDENFVKAHMDALSSREKTVVIGSKHCVLRKYTNSLKIFDSVKKGYMDLLVRNKKNVEGILKEEQELLTADTLRDNFHEAIRRCYLFEGPDNFPEVRKVFTDKLENFHFGWVLATTGNMSYQRLDEQLVDENFNGWGGEDTDLAFQFYLKGYSFVFNPEAINYHQEHPRERELQNELFANARYMYEKYSMDDKTSLLIMLWLRTFAHSSKITLSEANAIYENYIKISDTALAQDYIAYAKHHAASLFNLR
ncbi:glycosyltransferase family 2 protein [Paenibacillus aceti]|uniref:Glycosyltransferase 2-like domain-containing protein n=1 Tax=Paenibacillus aceti TaxID=1820010 RepID=A0ABQ1W6T4_9BACL|nr:glycosyltransferase family 2 protein [Paenibacillus aceti]GGG17908.1 hypothetical protein GCM10010913_45010 [Paenibacillus aceti]